MVYLSVAWQIFITEKVSLSIIEASISSDIVPKNYEHNFARIFSNSILQNKSIL